MHAVAFFTSSAGTSWTVNVVPTSFRLVPAEGCVVAGLGAAMVYYHCVKVKHKVATRDLRTTASHPTEFEAAKGKNYMSVHLARSDAAVNETSEVHNHHRS